MKLLLDTCTFIWLASRPRELSAKARAVLGDQGNSLWLSDVSVWEICLKWEAKKLVLPTPPRRWVPEQAKVWQLQHLAIAAAHLFRAVELPRLHRDPFDRLLVAQAIREDLTLLTPDPAIAAYPSATLW